VVGFFGTAFSLVDRAFLAVLLDAVDFFEDEADGLALDVEAALEVDAAFSAGLLFVFAEEDLSGLSFAEAVERRALVAALGLLLSLKGLLFLAFVSADFFATAFTFSDVDCGRRQQRLGSGEGVKIRYLASGSGGVRSFCSHWIRQTSSPRLLLRLR
jgi:hypothetical protein